MNNNMVFTSKFKFLTTSLVFILVILFSSCESSKNITKQKIVLNKKITPKEKRRFNIRENEKKITSHFMSNRARVKNDSLAIEIYEDYALNYEKIRGLDYLEKYLSKCELNSFKSDSFLSDSILIILADENYKLKRLDHSQKFYRKLIYKNKEMKKKYSAKLFSIMTTKEKALQIYSLGLEFFNDKDFNKALNKFKSALNKQADLKKAMFRKEVTKGLIYLSKKDKKLVKAAVECFEKAINISPEIGETYYYYAIAHIKKNNPNIEKARSYFEKALKSELTENMRVKVAAKFEEFKVKFQK